MDNNCFEVTNSEPLCQDVDYLPCKHNYSDRRKDINSTRHHRPKRNKTTGYWLAVLDLYLLANWFEGLNISLMRANYLMSNVWNNLDQITRLKYKSHARLQIKQSCGPYAPCILREARPDIFSELEEVEQEVSRNRQAVFRRLQFLREAQLGF